MKANIVNGKITVFHILPDEWKTFLNFKKADENLLRQEGFFDLIIPEYNQLTQDIGEIYFDEGNKVFSYEIIEKVIDIEALLNRRLFEFEEFQKRFRREITELFLEEIALGILPETVKQLILTLKQRSSEIIEELKVFALEENIERLTNYTFETEEAQHFREMLKSLKQ